MFFGTAKPSLLALAVVVALAGSAACQRRDSKPRLSGGEPETDRTNGSQEDEAQDPKVEKHQAQATIIEARCKREARCEHVGPAGVFSTDEACKSELAEKSKNELETSACEEGVTQSGLEGCVAAISHESCSNPLDALDRLAACASSQLCG